VLFRLGSVYGTHVGTSAAVYAKLGVDNVYVVALGNGFRGTFRFAGSARYAIVGNMICHRLILLADLSIYILTALVAKCNSF
jgi:hypothetical protein